MLLIWYPKCSTCRKAKRFLEEKGAEFSLRDITENPPEEKELKEWQKKSALPWKRFFNTSGRIYKEANLKEKLPNLTESEILSLLSSNGMLVKRPILLAGEKVLVGFKEEEYEEVLQ